MVILFLYLFLFLFGCFIGWIIELLFRRFFSAKKWVNPGFMKGPWLPLYGSGLIVMFSMCFICVKCLPESLTFYNPLGGLFGIEGNSGPSIPDLIPISLMWISMIVLEFLAGLIFIKGFHVKLWDYSNMKGNIMGIVCPLFSFFWLIIVLLYYYALNPFVYRMMEELYRHMFVDGSQAATFSFIFVLGGLYGIMLIDFIGSINPFYTISQFARKHGIIAKAEEVRSYLLKNSGNLKDKLSNYLPKKKGDDKLKKKIDQILLIDPNLKKDTSDNYDEKGRPIKIDK